MIDLAGLLVVTALLVTLVTLEVRHAGPDPRQTAPPRFFGRAVSRGAIALMWMMCLLLFLPRLLELLT
ncbi:hypothetical protein FBY31_3725 [Arthrobacter sp. SLBN-100]|jgi:hypothetical protein|uniref:hypothetical protein n=1 Tax=Arthrobacter sp. SLBN-100 TaxID=2768450 RepID=UPI001154763D|nr:hypothetical protein [Arthrobacter sp. SLBN-100]TQJ69572.1 hypothetical protein FBY31_3725 [Arthrobacter sp. SLBN-100]